MSPNINDNDCVSMFDYTSSGAPLRVLRHGVSHEAVISFIDAITDVFIELGTDEVTHPLYLVDGLLAESIDSAEQWGTSVEGVEAHIDQMSERLRSIAAFAALRPAPHQQLRLAGVS